MVVGQSFVALSSTKGAVSWFLDPSGNIVTIADAVLFYALVMTSWVGYHTSTEKLPIRSPVRFGIDVVLLFFYSLAFLNVDSYGKIALILLAVFVLYLAWQVVRLYEYWGERSKIDIADRPIQTVWFVIAFLLIVLIRTYYGSPTLDGMMLTFSFFLLFLFRYLTKGGPEEKNA